MIQNADIIEQKYSEDHPVYGEYLKQLHRLNAAQRRSYDLLGAHDVNERRLKEAQNLLARAEDLAVAAGRPFDEDDAVCAARQAVHDAATAVENTLADFHEGTQLKRRTRALLRELNESCGVIDPQAALELHIDEIEKAQRDVADALRYVESHARHFQDRLKLMSDALTLFPDDHSAHQSSRHVADIAVSTDLVQFTMRKQTVRTIDATLNILREVNGMVDPPPEDVNASSEGSFGRTQTEAEDGLDASMPRKALDEIAAQAGIKNPHNLRDRATVVATIRAKRAPAM